MNLIYTYGSVQFVDSPTQSDKYPTKSDLVRFLNEGGNRNMKVRKIHRGSKFLDALIISTFKFRLCCLHYIWRFAKKIQPCCNISLNTVVWILIQEIGYGNKYYCTAILLLLLLLYFIVWLALILFYLIIVARNSTSSSS